MSNTAEFVRLCDIYLKQTNCTKLQLATELEVSFTYFSHVYNNHGKSEYIIFERLKKLINPKPPTIKKCFLCKAILEAKNSFYCESCRAQINRANEAQAEIFKAVLG